ncbi:hypothetical protein ACWED2_06605 [Amycolatopsis sp. NPDC005003]
MLLGPVGSGKTHALHRIDADLGWGVVHSRFDFGDSNANPADVLTRLVYGFSRSWRHRAKPRFLRFALALIAAQADLGTTDYAQDKATLRRLLEEFHRDRRPRWVDATIGLGVRLATATGAVPAPYADAFSAELPKLVQAVRPRLAQALRSLRDVEWFQGGDAYDALIDLNRLARGREADAELLTAWLIEAFLADVRENHRRMSGPERRSPCDCPDSRRKPHSHTWVALLDNVDHPGGLTFLRALTAARERHRGTADPLLVVATSGSWQGEWGDELGRTWRPPWQPENGVGRTVPACSQASYEHWADPADARSSAYYPVLLEPLAIGGVTELLGRDVPRARAEFAHRATGGLPGAVKHVARVLPGREIVPGARDLLGDNGPGPWQSWLSELGLSAVEMDELVAAAPFATAPWLVQPRAEGATVQPRIGTILTELRASLWVRASGHDGTQDQVTLHPWLAGNLTSALARRDDDAPGYRAQFTALRTIVGTDDVRRAYCLLALGEFPAVVDLFERDFPDLPHLQWLDRLTLVVHAPDNQPLTSGYDELREQLVKADREHQPDRTPLRSELARLIAASWLVTNPFAVRGSAQNRDIELALVNLSRTSERADTAHLYTFADRAARGLWP